MIFMQIIIGGITRLTGSGLSITKWEIVTGTLPPMNHDTWQSEFDLYKETPQYKKINKGMSLGEFKFIYFWEYFHRLWARTMGLVFAIPFLFFWWKGHLDKKLLQRLGITVLLAALVASFGWIMVASGLIERPWVNAYKLTMHLSLALILFGYLYYVIFHVFRVKRRIVDRKSTWWLGIIIVVFVTQVVLGGIMSGMKAALSYPTWPDMHHVFIPDVLLDLNNWTVSNFAMYDQNTFMPAFIQFFHRLTAYVLLFVISAFLLVKKRSTRIRRGSWFMFIAVLIQALFGILTVIHSKGMIPVSWGVLHQGGAIILLMAVFYTRFWLKRR